MQSFKDSKGVAWDIEIGLGQLALVKARVGLDLQHLVTGKDDHKSTIAELGDPSKLFDVLLALTEKQRTDRSVDVDSFGALLNNAELTEAAFEAVIQATIDFFPPRSRDAMRTAVATIKKVGTEVRNNAIGRMEALMANPVKLEAAIKSTLSKSATDSPESSESTPANTLGETST